MFKSTRTQTLKDYDFKIKQIFFFLPLIFCQSCIIFAKQCVCKRGTNSPLQHVKCWRTLLKLSPIPGSYPLPLVNICPLRAESPFKSLVQYQLSSVYVATSPFEGQNWKLMVGNEPKAKHLLCFIVIMQNGTGVPRPLNWLTSCAKMRKVLNDNKGCESIFITRKINIILFSLWETSAGAKVNLTAGDPEQPRASINRRERAFSTCRLLLWWFLLLPGITAMPFVMYLTETGEERRSPYAHGFTLRIESRASGLWVQCFSAADSECKSILEHTCKDS